MAGKIEKIITKIPKTMSKSHHEVAYTSPRLTTYCYDVECGFQGTVGFIQSDNGGNKSIADPDVVEIESW